MPVKKPLGGMALKAVLVTVSTFVLASLLVVLYTAHETRDRASRTTATRLNQLLETVDSTLRVACFVKDEQLSQEIADGLLRNSEVQRVQIISDGRVLAEHRKGQEGTVQPAAESGLLLKRVIHSPFDETLAIGEIQLHSDPRAIADIQQAEMAVAIRSLLWQLSLVSLAVVLALVVFILRPIKQMSDQLADMNPESGEKLPIPAGHQRTEIGLLAASINRLAARLTDAISEAQHARNAAEHAAGAKAIFLANMSHEIRSPLNAILGFSMIGKRAAQDAGARDSFGKICDAGHHLLGVLNDILDFSKVEAGKLLVEEVPVNIATLVRQTRDLVLDAAEKKCLQCTFDVDSLVPAWILSDPHRLQQVLVNLMTNAVKFTASGEVRLHVSREAGELCFTVSDTGIGMSEATLQRLFQPFEQADTSTTRRYGGTGLGLAISQNIAGLMGGGIKVSSIEGQGSTFTLHFPLKVSAVEGRESLLGGRDEASLLGRKLLTGVSLLVAEDIPLNQEVISYILRESGAEFSCVADGQAAVDAVRARPGGFDLILMDIQMPKLDGYQATREIHQLVPTLPVIGLTAHALVEEKHRCLEAGMCDHVTKPVDVSALIGAIAAHLPPARAARINGVLSGLAGEAVAVQADGEQLPVMDWDKLRERFKRNAAMIGKLLAIFNEHHAGSPAQLRQLYAQRDWKQLEYKVHALIGVAGNLSAPRLAALARGLEQSCIAAQDNDTLAEDELLAFTACVEETLAEVAKGPPQD